MTALIGRKTTSLKLKFSTSYYAVGRSHGISAYIYKQKLRRKRCEDIYNFNNDLDKMVSQTDSNTDIKLYLILLVMSHSDMTASSTQIVALVRNIIELSFSKRQCLLHVTDTSYESWYVDRALLEVDAIFLQTKMEDLANFLRQTPKCSGHVIVANNNTSLPKNAIHHFPSAGDTGQNFRVLVFQQQNCSTVIEKLEDLYPVGTEIIVAQLSESDVHQEIVADQVYVTFVWKNKRVTLDSKQNYLIDPTHFELKRWKPKLKQKIRISLFHCPPYVLHDEITGSYDGIEYNMIKEVTDGWPVEYLLHNKKGDIYVKWMNAIQEVCRRQKRYNSLSPMARFCCFKQAEDLYELSSTTNLSYISGSQTTATCKYFLRVPTNSTQSLVIGGVCHVDVCHVLAFHGKCRQ